MGFGNFYVGENEVAKNYKGCYKRNTSLKNTPLKSVNTCLEDGSLSGASVFSITNLNENGMAQCVSGNDGISGTFLKGVSEESCLTQNDTNTAYNIIVPRNGREALGKTYMGVKKDNSEKMIFHEYPSSLLKIGNQYNKYSNYDIPNNNLSNANITDSTSEECKQYCLNRGQDCKGFVYNKANNTCQLKNAVYPNTSRAENNNTDIYTRMPKVMNNDSCPKGVVPINSEFLNKRGFISSDPMSMDFKCETENEVKEISDEENMLKTYNTLNQEITGIRQENDRILNGFNKVRKNVKKATNKYNENEEKIHYLENPTTERLLLDTNQLETMFSMRNTGLVIALILLSIFLLRVLRK